MQSPPNTRHSAIVGSLLGTAIGDALGLPYEGLSARRAAKMLGAPDRFRLVFGHGMVSDDTEHTCMVAQALIASGNDDQRFQRDLAWRLRWWLLALPAGIGFATLRALIKLWLGFNADHSGVYSAGNGPAMRAGIIGATIDDVAQLRLFVRASTRITHTDPKAEYGAYAVALAATMARDGQTVGGQAYLQQLREALQHHGDELIVLVQNAVDSVSRGESTVTFVQSMGLRKGVTGYIYDTVPAAIHAWLAHQHDLRAALTAIITCGGDTDTTAAIVGSIVGAAVGKEGIPQEWQAMLTDWPRSINWMERLAAQLAEAATTRTAQKPAGLFAPVILLRNMFFLLIVLFHGFRRLLPPY
jgi:ADP-ribosylglycohydrolase